MIFFVTSHGERRIYISDTSIYTYMFVYQAMMTNIPRTKGLESMVGTIVGNGEGGAQLEGVGKSSRH